MPMSVQAIKDKYQARLLAMPGVVSVGIGQDAAGTKLIVIGINTNDSDIIAALPKKLDEVQVQIQVIGSVQAQD